MFLNYYFNAKNENVRFHHPPSKKWKIFIFAFHPLLMILAKRTSDLEETFSIMTTLTIFTNSYRMFPTLWHKIQK